MRADGVVADFLREVFAALPQATGVRIGLLCSTNGQLTDACSEAFLQGELLETSAGIQQIMVGVVDTAAATAVCAAAVTAEERRQGVL